MECSEKPLFKKYAEVVFDFGLSKPLDYGIPDEFLNQVAVGIEVEVLLNRKKRFGFITSIKEESTFSNVLPLIGIASQAKLPSDLIELANWTSRYYLTPLAKVLRSMMGGSKETSEKSLIYVKRALSIEKLRSEIPLIREKSAAQAAILEIMLDTKKGIFLTDLLEKTATSKSPVDTLAKKGFLTLEKVRRDLSSLTYEDYFKTSKKHLSEEQNEALQKIQNSLKKNEFRVHLLFGITGSGKTEVYLQAIEATLSLKKSALIMVPEIALTPQTIERFKSRFDEKIAVIHSQISDSERARAWKACREGEIRLVIGARSALFAPLQNLGLLIVDEEHDSAYKQQEKMPCYHARDLAVIRAKMVQGAIVLGSASPSLETYANAEKNKYELSTLTKRPSHFKLPKVTLVDMRREFEKARGFTPFSEALLEGIKCRFKAGEQVILFLNRRGYHSSLFCLSCGYIFKCPRCDISLTFHKNIESLSCHFCEYGIRAQNKCPKCNSQETLKYKGIGTENVEKSLQAIFQGIRTLRIDHDTTKEKGSFDELYRTFRTGKADVLIGTQMIAKGLHFPLVSLVGILNTDGALHIPDFRSSEAVFQLITQVSGRSGRNLEGEVILQTLMPDNPIIQLAAKNDYVEFKTKELTSRQFFGYPPYSHLIKFLFSGKSSERVQIEAEKFRKEIISILKGIAIVHPLTPAGHPKINERFRFHFLVRTQAILKTNDRIKNLLEKTTLSSDIHLLIDVDPLFTFF